MPPQALPRSFKRKYKKLHGRFTTIQAATALLEEDLNIATTTALKLIAENDTLLDLLVELNPGKSPVRVQDQLSNDLRDDDSTVDDNTSGEVLDDDYYAAEIPEHFDSLPWNLDLQSFSGSHLEDLAKAAALTITTNAAPAQETPSANPTSRKANARGTISKKRERAEADEEQNGTATKKKKRKSMLIHNNESWTS
ncbi:protein of unknown function [Taphrina deformans PYCC 5710]|uniref:INO80 complex subunit 3 N-terminal domain-containing protein n=1 Tax=Taphrina deformans (strain PYCC 5710 / ATCC 11124 / CBS 356.35 / IMI 108563 / JCM 9778 / NBRC 8474) TaxID=1097556 RepID=R4XAR8_TAPDE|nr:protein of unknown function [Taphrina deformans PYCC 5710]|eukprot:CCG81418.1 protein of unknown function [Taphrina deformans PYCC 5710]